MNSALPGPPKTTRESDSDSSYLAGRKAIWTWIATPGGLELQAAVLLGDTAVLGCELSGELAPPLSSQRLGRDDSLSG